MTQRTRKPGKSWTHCRGIQEQFVEKILSGEKTTTIRPDAKNMQAGDRIKFFTGWRKLGALYRVKVDVTGIQKIKITQNDFILLKAKSDGSDFSFKSFLPEILEVIAEKDGFNSFDEMVAFFKAAYPKNRKAAEWSFSGVLITFFNPALSKEAL